MAFDSTCKFIAEQFPEDIAAWLLGRPITLTKLEPKELSVEPIRADSLIFLESEQEILHVEFQVDPKPDIPFRITDYRLRLFRRSPEKEVRQVVVYLRRSTSPLVYQQTFELRGLRYEFEVVRLWESPVERFLELPGLLPFAVLSQTTNPEAVLRQLVPKIEEISNRQQQSNVAASTALLAGLVLEKQIIQRVLRQDIMKESVIFQEIDATAEARGFQLGLQKEKALVLRQLDRQVGQISPSLKAAVEALPFEKIDALGEALLDFSSEKDLQSWLQGNA